jgi:hypothetical protein
VRKHTSISISDLLLEKSTSLMTAIVLFFKNTLIFFRHDYFYNLGHTVLMGPKIYADAKEALDNAIVEYDQALLLQVTIKILDMDSTAPKTVVDVEARKSELMGWLDAAHWEAEAQFETNCELRAQETLQWVLEAEEFKAWRMSKARTYGPMLWMHGLPGMGKSIISAYLVQALKAQYPEAVVLYFFCKAGDQKLDNVDSLARTLASQLALTLPDSREVLQKLKDDGFRPGAFSQSFSRLVVDTLKELSQRTFIVIDGLDECFGESLDVKDRSPITKLLEALKKLDARVLVSSRPTPEISHALPFTLSRALTFEDNRDYIEKFVLMRVSKSRNLKRGFQRSGKDPISAVVEKSQGNFLWASVVLNILEKTASARAFQAALDKLPAGIAGVYDRLLDKLEAAGTLDVAMAILECVLFPLARKNFIEAPNLTIPELQAAVGQLEDEILDLEEFVRTNCGSFLGIVPSEKGPMVHIVHETFRAYITDPKASINRFLLPARSHARLAWACLGCFLDPNNEELDPFMKYATTRWWKHFHIYRKAMADVPAADSLALFTRIHQLFTDKSGALHRWMRACCLPAYNSTDMGILMANIH